MKVVWVTFLVHLFLQWWQAWLLTSVQEKTQHWETIKEIIWQVSFLEHCIKNNSCLQETVSLLDQYVGEENQGQLQNDKESKILTKDFKR